MDMLKEAKKNATVPNFLTLLRIVLIVPMSHYILKESYLYAGSMLLLSAISDMLDGVIARKFHQVTQLGKILDPIADKLTLIVIVLSLSVNYPYVYPFVAVMLVKEILMLTGGAILLKKKIRPPAAKWFGKAATAFFYGSVITVIGLRALWNINLPWLVTGLFALSTGLMVFALLNYGVMFLMLIKEN